ncbi:hypothetical protein [Luteimicrobium subarcticum]|uniref:Uncharacterized protein n=1 Tax=Luteimicrobium subarcticum TaxID=620910 RepID=A0A2M8WTJ4_9MICO|nr:hypothetical protein [Luteimicrobium subarcticum]PJI94277.1 hypothetical protein CLV34_1765 [Luteimicrobium subarcticum]
MAGQVGKGDGETPLSVTERDELESLRAEVTSLRVETAEAKRAAAEAAVTPAAPVKRSRDRHWVRWTAAVVIIALAALLSIGAVAARYVKGQLLDTDHYVATVAPLASDPAIQAAVAGRVSTAIEDQLDLESLTTQALTAITDNAPRVPEALVGLAPVIASQANGFIEKRVDDFVQSPAFQNLWVEANRAAHKNLSSVLTGGDGAALTANADGQVTLQLAPIIDAVKERLSAQGLNFVDKLPQVDATFVVFSSPDIAALQRWVNFFDHAATWLIWIAVALAAAGVLVAPRGSRRRAAVIAGVFVTVAMLLLALGIAVGRTVYLGALSDVVIHPTAAEALFDTIVQPLRVALRVVLVVALVVAIAAFLVGPSPAAVAVRNGFMKLVGLASGGRAGETTREPRTWEVWIARFRIALTVLIIGLAALLVAFWHYPTGMVVFWIALLAVVLVVAVQVLAAPARGSVAGTPSSGAPGELTP